MIEQYLTGTNNEILDLSKFTENDPALETIKNELDKHPDVISKQGAISHKEIDYLLDKHRKLQLISRIKDNDSTLLVADLDYKESHRYLLTAEEIQSLCAALASNTQLKVLQLARQEKTYGFLSQLAAALKGTTLIALYIKLDSPVTPEKTQLWLNSLKQNKTLVKLEFWLPQSFSAEENAAETTEKINACVSMEQLLAAIATIDYLSTAAQFFTGAEYAAILKKFVETSHTPSRNEITGLFGIREIFFTLLTPCASNNTNSSNKTKDFNTAQILTQLNSKQLSEEERAKIDLIAQCESYKELYSAIRMIEPIKGATKIFTAEDLIKLCDDYATAEEDDKNLCFIPKIYGLRQKLYDLTYPNFAIKRKIDNKDHTDENSPPNENKPKAPTQKKARTEYNYLTPPKEVSMFEEKTNARTIFTHKIG